MPLTPEQRQAWESEKAERAEREKGEKELLLKQQSQTEQIDQAIHKVEWQEKKKKLLMIGLIAVFYGLVGVWYLFLRK